MCPCYLEMTSCKLRLLEKLHVDTCLPEKLLVHATQRRLHPKHAMREVKEFASKAGLPYMVVAALQYSSNSNTLSSLREAATELNWRYILLQFYFSLILKDDTNSRRRRSSWHYVAGMTCGSIYLHRHWHRQIMVTFSKPY